MSGAWRRVGKITPWTPAASALRSSVPTFCGSSSESRTRTNGGSPRSSARARMSSSEANRRGSTTRATPWWPSKPAIAVSEPPSTSTIGMRRRVAWRTSCSSALRRCGTTSRRWAVAAGREDLLDRATAGDELLVRPEQLGRRQRFGPAVARPRPAPGATAGGHGSRGPAGRSCGPGRAGRSFPERRSPRAAVRWWTAAARRTPRAAIGRRPTGWAPRRRDRAAGRRGAA